MNTKDISVTYISHMGTDMTVVNRARKSTDKIKPEDAELSKEDISLIRYLARGYSKAEWDSLLQEIHNKIIVSSRANTPAYLHDLLWQVKTKATHFAPFTHPQVTFSITAPLAIAMQLWRSHVGASGGDSGYAGWSQLSRRYVSTEPDIYSPMWRHAANSVKQGSAGNVDRNTQELLDFDFTNVVENSLNFYNQMIESGIAPEQARLVLPECTMTTWDWTGSLMFWARICWLRQESHAQKEASYVADGISNCMFELFPVSWDALITGGKEEGW